MRAPMATSSSRAALATRRGSARRAPSASASATATARARAAAAAAVASAPASLGSAARRCVCLAPLASCPSPGRPGRWPGLFGCGPPAHAPSASPSRRLRASGLGLGCALSLGPCESGVPGTCGGRARAALRAAAATLGAPAAWPLRPRAPLPGVLAAGQASSATALLLASPGSSSLCLPRRRDFWS